MHVNKDYNKNNEGKTMDDRIISEFMKRDLRFYIDILIDDEEFVDDIEKSKIFHKFKDLNLEEKKEVFNAYIGNTARTFIMCNIVAKHIHKKMYALQDKFLDPYWKERFDKVDKNI